MLQNSLNLTLGWYQDPQKKTEMHKFGFDLLLAFQLKTHLSSSNGKTIRVIERSDYLRSDPAEQNLVPIVAQL